MRLVLGRLSLKALSLEEDLTWIALVLLPCPGFESLAPLTPQREMEEESQRVCRPVSHGNDSVYSKVPFFS